jgi:hypothetical protein
MRVAAIYDIHGNLPALEAVLQDSRQAKLDQRSGRGRCAFEPDAARGLNAVVSLDEAGP